MPARLPPRRQTKQPHPIPLSAGHDLLTGAANEADEYRAHDPAGRAIFKAAAYLPPHDPVDDDYPLQLTTGRTVCHWHTRTKTRRAGQLNAAAPRMWVELCPQDAHRLGIGEGDLVRVESRHGSIQGAARLSGTRPGVVFAPFHYGYFDTPGGSRPDGAASAANEATRTEWDPVSKQPIVKVTAVRVAKLASADGQPAPAPATAASAPVTDIGPHTRGGPAAEAASHTGASP